jgi:hypothetical protein
MKQRHYITTVSLIMVLTGLSPVVADAESSARTDPRPFESPLGYKLTTDQMDGIHGGMINLCDAECPRPLPPQNGNGAGYWNPYDGNLLNHPEDDG